LIDRQMQRKENFSGIVGVNTQDRAVQEMQGRITDRTKEHLGPADQAIIACRQRLLRAVHAVQSGENPPGADDSYYRARAAVKIIPADAAWKSNMLQDMDPGAM
jgi:hypothetical protein